MKSRRSFLFGLVMMLLSASVGYAQSDWYTVNMVNGQTIYIDGNLYPNGYVLDDGGVYGSCSNGFDGYVVISVDTGKAIQLWGIYSFRDYNGRITIWDGDTNGVPLHWRLTGIGLLNVTARSGSLTIRLQTDSSELYLSEISLEYAVASPNTCTGVRDLMVMDDCCDCDPMYYTLSWQYYWQPDHWEVEYGPHGFELGSGTVVETNENYFSISEIEFQGLLRPNTVYDFYVRSVCEGGLYGEWDSVSYRTYCAEVDSIIAWGADVTVTPAGLLAGYKVTWRDTADTRQWYVDYYRTDSPPIDWDRPYKSDNIVDTPVFYFPPLAPNTSYTFVLRSNCDGSYGIEQWIMFTTIAVGIDEADASSLSVNPNPANGRCVVSLADDTPAELMLYGSDGRLLQTIAYKGAPIELQLPSQGVYLLQATTAGGTFTRKIVNK